MATPTWSDLEPRLQALLDRPLAAADVPAFLRDADAIERDVGEAYASLMRAKDEDTADEVAAAAFLAFVQDVLPRLEPMTDALHRKLLAVPDYAPPADLAPTWADLQDASLASVPASNFVWQHSLHAGPVLTHSEPTSGVSWAEARAKRAERTAMVFIVRDRFEARSMSF